MNRAFFTLSDLGVLHGLTGHLGDMYPDLCGASRLLSSEEAASSSSESGGHASHGEPGTHNTTFEEGIHRMQEQLRADIPALVQAILRDLPPPPAELLRRRP